MTNDITIEEAINSTLIKQTIMDMVASKTEPTAENIKAAIVARHERNIKMVNDYLALTTEERFEFCKRQGLC